MRPAFGYTRGMSTAPRAKLWIGPSGWSYADWAGIVYPAKPPRGFKPLAYLARYFNAVEVNTSFYRIPTARMTAAWPRLVPRDFRFAVKLTQVFTHERGTFPSPATVDEFNAGIAPLREADLLGPLLVQFPWSFRYTPDAIAWLHRLAESFAAYDRFIEVRHASWAAPEALAELRKVGGYCNIDQPALRDCLGPTQHAFGRNAYVRLHGRNARNWFAEGVPAFERYNYLYSPDELREWVARLDAMCTETENMYVFANNHYRGQGAVNALELRAMLENAPVAAPRELLDAYPRLAALARSPRDGGLFDT
ncbi:MAG: DUF72 domain-containing protein [Phycisphaerae bacterium]|nr:DUF72 domain-containing protein [Phycisphaerae bacterium]